MEFALWVMPHATRPRYLERALYSQSPEFAIYSDYWSGVHNPRFGGWLHWQNSALTGISLVKLNPHAPRRAHGPDASAG